MAGVVLWMTLLFTPPGFSSTFKGGDIVHITNLEEIDDDLYAASEEVLVAGTITGDLVAAGDLVRTTGEIGGSANLFGRKAEHSGRVEGSLRCGAQYVQVDGYVAGSLLAAGAEVTVGNRAVIERDASCVGTDIELAGVIKGNVFSAGTTVRISGLVEGDVEVRAERIAILPSAVIKGSLIYKSEKEDALELMGDATVIGEITWDSGKDGAEVEDEDEESDFLSGAILLVSDLFAAFLFGIIMIRLFPRYAEESVNQLRKRASVSLAAGLLGLLIAVACAVVLVLALIGSLAGGILLSSGQILASAILLILSTLTIPIASFGAVTGSILLYSGKIVFGMLAGYVILRIVRKDIWTVSKTALFIGLLILGAVCAIPYYIGPLIAVLAALTGCGAIVLAIRKLSQEQRDLLKKVVVRGRCPTM